MIVSAGAAFLPSCFQQKDAAVFPLKNIRLTADEQNMLAALATAILPKTNSFIGAADLKAHEFVLTMMDDCSSPDEQQQFLQGMQVFKQYSKQVMGVDFTTANNAQIQQLLTSLDAKESSATKEAVSFYQTVKKYTVQCFTSSKQYMTEVRHYNIIPGSKFKGCVPVKKA
jgi:hypothetical protein